MRTFGNGWIRVGAGRARVLPRHRLRRVIGLLTLVVFIFGQCASAMATSARVTFHLKVAPISVSLAKLNGPSHSDTGKVLGGGAAVEGDAQIRGDEYGGFPPPLTGVSGVRTDRSEVALAGTPDFVRNCVLESHQVVERPRRSSFKIGCKKWDVNSRTCLRGCS